MTKLLGGYELRVEIGMIGSARILCGNVFGVTYENHEETQGSLSPR
jgi:hypothetical protein